jgi:hypothetical protein
MVDVDDRETAFMPAIAALRSELADLERRAAQTRELIGALCERAGGAGDPPRPDAAATPTPAKAAVATRAPHARRRHLPPRGSPPGAAKPTTTPAKPGNGVDQLAKITAAVAEAADLVAAATRAKDGEQLKTAIAGRARAERRAGELLIALAGKVRPLPGVSKLEAKRWRRAAALSEKDFEDKLQRAQRKAIAAVGDSPKRGVARVEGKTSTAARPKLAMKLSDWKKEADGSLSRTLSAAADGEAPGSTAAA